MAYTQDEGWVSSTQDVFPAHEEGRPDVSVPVANNRLQSPKTQGKGQKTARMNGQAPNNTSAVDANSKSLYSTFSWLKGFHNTCQANVGSESIQKLESIITEFIGLVTPEAKNCLSKPVRSAKLKRCFIDALTYFHFFYQEVKGSLDPTQYLEKMTGLLAMYLDLEIRSSIRGKENSKKIASRITSVLYLVLDNSEEHILDAVLQCQSILKSYKHICSPILSKILADIQRMPRPELLYIRLLLAFKLWKTVSGDAEEKKRLNRLASDRLPCPPTLLERPRFLADVLPRIPKKKRKNVTHFLMMSKFSVKDATQAFLRVTKGGQQEYGHIFSEYDSLLYFPNQYSSLFESSSEMEGESNCDALLNHMWSSLSIESLGDVSVVRPIPRNLKPIPPAPLSAPASSCTRETAPAPFATIVEDTRKRKHLEDSGSEQLRQKKKKRRKDNSPENNAEKEKSKGSEKKDGYESSHKECEDVSNKSRQEMLTLYNETSTCRLERAFNAVADFKDKLTILSRSERPSLLVEVKKEKIDSVLEEQTIYDEALPQSLLLLPPPPPPPECPAETATSQQTPSPSPPPLPVASPPRPPPPPDNVDEDSGSMDCYDEERTEDSCTSQIVDDILNPGTLHGTVSPTTMSHVPPSYTPPLQCDAAIPTSVPNAQEFPCKVVVSGPTTVEEEELVKSTQALPPPPQQLLPMPQNEQILESNCMQSEVSEQHLLLSPHSVIVSPLQPRPPTLASSECSLPMGSNMAPTLTETEPETHEEETSNKMDPVMPSPLADPLKDGHIAPSMMRSTDVDCTEIFYRGAPLKQEVEDDKSIENKTPVHSQSVISPDIEDETKKVYFDYGVLEVPPDSFFCQRQNEYHDWFGNPEYFTVDTSEDGLSDISNKPYYEIDDGRPIPIYDGNFNKEFFIDNMDIDIDLASIEDSPKKCTPSHKPIPMVIKEECSSSRSSASTDMGLKYGSPASLYAPCSPESSVSVSNRVTPEMSNKTCTESTNIPTLVQETETPTDLESEPLSERLQPTVVDTESMPILEPEHTVTENLAAEKAKKSESSRKSSKDRSKKSSEHCKKSEHSKKDKKSHHKKSKSEGDKKLSEEKAKKSSSKKKSSESKSKDHASKTPSLDPVTRPGHVDKLFANHTPTAVPISKLTLGAPKKSTVVDIKVGSGHISRPVAELNRRLSIPPSSASTSLAKSSIVSKPPSESAKPLIEPAPRIPFFNASFKIPQISQLSRLASSRKPVEVADEFDFLGTSDNDFSSSSDSTIPTSKGMSKLVFPEHIICYAIKHKLLYPRGHNLFKENVKMLRNLLSRFSSSPDRKYIYFYRKNPQNSEQVKRMEGQGALSSFKSKAASKSFCSSPVSSTSQKPKPSTFAAPKPTSKHTESHFSSSKVSKSVSRQSTSKADISHKFVPNRKDRVATSSTKPSSLPATSFVPNVKTVVSPSSSSLYVHSKSTVSKSIPNAAPKPSTLKSQHIKSTSSSKPSVDFNPKSSKVVSVSKPTTVSNSKISDVPTPKSNVNVTSQKPVANKPTINSNPKIPKAVSTPKLIDTTPQKPVAASPKPTTASHSQKPKAASPKPTSTPNPQISGTAHKSAPEPKPQFTKTVSSSKLTANTIPTSASEAPTIPTLQILKAVSAPEPTATPYTEIPKATSATKPITNLKSIIEKDMPTPTARIPKIAAVVSVPKPIATPNLEIPSDVSVPKPVATPDLEIPMDVCAPESEMVEYSDLVIDESPQMPMANSPEPTIVTSTQRPITVSCALTVDTNPQIIISAPSPSEIVNTHNSISAPTSVVSSSHISLTVPTHQPPTPQMSISRMATPPVIMSASSASLNSPVQMPLSPPPSVPMRVISPQPPVMPSISGGHQMVHQVPFGTTALPPHIPVSQHIESTREVSCIVNRNVPMGPPTIPIPQSETYYTVNGLAIHPSIGDDDLRKKVEEAIKTLESERVPDRQKVNSLPLKKRKQAVSQADVDCVNVREQPVAPSLDSYPPTLMLSIAECVAEIERKKISEAQALLNSVQPSAVEMRSRHVMTRPPVLAASSIPPPAPPPPPPPIVTPAMRETTFPYPHSAAHTAKTIVPLTERISGTYHTNLVSIPRITFERQRSPDSQIQVALQYKKPEDIRTVYRPTYTYTEERIRRPVDLTLETAPSVSVEQKSRNARKIATKKKTEEERSKTSRRRAK